MKNALLSRRYGYLSILFIASLAFAAHAATWYVDSDAPPGGDGKSWATAFDTISEAITAASPLYLICYAPNDQIWVKSGTYTLTSELTQNKVVIIYGGFPNSYSSPTMANRNPDAYQTVINGNNTVRCMNISAYCVIDGFTFQNGRASSGAAIYAESPTYDCLGGDLSTTIKNCKFIDNFATVVGGAIYDLRSNLVITNCRFEGNSADNGGALWQWDTTSAISKCVFNANESTTGGFGGGAILGDYQTYGTITNCLFTNNTSVSNGGAISYHQAWTTITNCTFANNTSAFASSGGALYTNTSSPVLKNCILWGNSPNQIIDYYSSPGPTATYCDIQGGFSGAGNINLDPLFVSSSDYHLALTSPCVDTGTNTGAPADDLDGTARPQDGDGDGTDKTDMGVYELTNVDLRITSIALDPEVPLMGEEVTVTVTVRNYGTTDAGEFYVDWYADLASAPALHDVGNLYKRFTGLAAGASGTMVQTYTYPSEGLKNMYAQADTEDEVDEQSESNNVYGPRYTWAMIGVLLDFNVIHDQHNASMWFGGDDGVNKRNVGVGQSITLTRPARVTAAGFNFTKRFDYVHNPDESGHSVTLIMYARRADGSPFYGTSKSVPSSFNGGWIMIPFANLWLEANQTYIFTCYLYQGEYNELTSGVYGRNDNPWPTSTGYDANVYAVPANMYSWSSWNVHSWDFNFQLTGQYIERYPGDINEDRSVNLGDLSVIGGYWLAADCLMPGWCDNSDINWNSHVKLEDFNIVSRYWKETYHEYDELNRAAIVTMDDEMTTANIYGSDGSEFKPGTYFIYKTASGRYGKFIVEGWNHADQNKLTIGWVTYNTNGTVYTSGTGLVIRGTYTCDLDLGLETSTNADFQWVQSTSSVRYLDPLSTARFKLMYKAP
jgi:predicted outer membrane repeat protein